MGGGGSDAVPPVNAPPPAGRLLILYGQGGEEDVALLVARRDVFTHEQEEGDEGLRLEDVEPGEEVDGGLGETDAEEGDQRVHRDEEGDPHDSGWERVLALWFSSILQDLGRGSQT